MNTNISIVLVVLVLLVGGFFIFSGNDTENAMQNENTDQMTGDAMMEGDDNMMEKDETSMMDDSENKMTGDNDTMMTKSGSYEAYAPEKLALASSGDVVLYFRASWCPTCKALDEDIKANMSAIPSDLTILDVDYDNSMELKTKYGVTYQHTFVQVDTEGNMLKKWSSSPTLSALTSEVI